PVRLFQQAQKPHEIDLAAIHLNRLTQAYKIVRALIAFTDKIIKGGEKSPYLKDAHLLAAQSYFEKENFTAARPYFEYYYENSDKIRKEDLYKIGYTYYRLNEWAAATEKFKALSDAHDSLGQASMYLLGDCYLKTGNRKSARSAFGICSRMDYSKKQQEAALMIYGRLSYEAGYNDEAGRAFSTLLEQFPKSGYHDEARTLLSSLYIKSNDYTGALNYLDGVSRHDDMYWKVHQLACFGKAVQLFQNDNFTDADDYFAKSIDHSVSPIYEAAAFFWRSELSFRLRKYNDAVSYGQYFLNAKMSQMDLDKISPQATAQHAWITMGFAAMELQDFTNAQRYFNQAENIYGGEKTTATLAALHEADAVFLQTNYSKALQLYTAIAAKDTTNADYANYQRSVILGLQGKNKDKIALLQGLLHHSPPSAYDMTARYELAVTFIEINQYPEALKHLKYITDTASDKAFGARAWLKTGFIAQQQNDNPTAIGCYKQVVTGYPASDERVAALDALRSLYIQTNQPGAFAALLREAGLPSSENTSIDSTYYSAAEAQFATGKWDAAVQGFGNYFTEFPNGVFAIKAHYYRGQSYYQLKKLKEALADFETVLKAPWNDFSENSVRNAAAIAYDLHDYKAAAAWYGKLRAEGPRDNATAIVAYTGILKSAYLDSNYETAGRYADTLLKQPGLSAEQISEALLYKANASVKTGQTDTALALYRQLADNKNGELAAEARYRIAEIYYNLDNLTEAENAANETIKVASGYEVWVLRSYLLLADILVKQKDYFNASATLNSIIQHTRNEAIKAEATARLATVKALEKTKTKLKD
ncbi:MAG: tetratricopeptide repeat protein, partial [Chitinophagia bacterium]|nr:tetratricopeptide repeat protein [Chitinophagia bacterium]